jgi:predicted Zn-dependent protease
VNGAPILESQKARALTKEDIEKQAAQMAADRPLALPISVREKAEALAAGKPLAPRSLSLRESEALATARAARPAQQKPEVQWKTPPAPPPPPAPPVQEQHRDVDVRDLLHLAREAKATCLPDHNAGGQAIYLCRAETEDAVIVRTCTTFGEAQKFLQGIKLLRADGGT